MLAQEEINTIWNGIVVDHIAIMFLVSFCSWMAGYGFFFGIIIGIPLAALTVLLIKLAFIVAIKKLN